ncbi:MAG: DUF433 domain-containing protein [Halobacteriota archaeon]
MDSNKEWRDFIKSDPGVMMGKPVIAGTRVTVEQILEKLAVGETIEQIIDEHPRLTKEGVYAALAFASEALRADVVYPIQLERKAGAKTSEVPG